MNFLKKHLQLSKKNSCIMAFLFIMVMSLEAQPLQKKKERPNFTSEQLATLQTKRMTLLLELTEKQQVQILAINKRKVHERKQREEARKERRKKGVKPTADELFKRKLHRLDTQIAYQKEMKKILNEKQFDTWKRIRKLKHSKLKKQHKKMCRS